MTGRFNLVDEKWITVAGRAGGMSLLDVFKEKEPCMITGNAIQKSALIRFLVAVAQASVRIRDDEEWKALGGDGVSERCISYLEEHHDDFFLYGDKPFLQFTKLADTPEAKRNRLIQAEISDLPADNASRVFDSQMGRDLDDAEKALFIIMLQNHALAGKHVTKPDVLAPFTPGYALKKQSAKAGPSIGNGKGRLFTFFLGSSIRETVWLNLLTDEDITGLAMNFRLDVRPPWEEMPGGEDDERARELKSSVYAWLCAMSRFVLLEGDSFCYEEGLQYVSSEKDRYREPFITTTGDGRDVGADVERKPWRDFPAMFQMSDPRSGCPLIRMCMNRTKDPSSGVGVFAIWCGGLQVHANSGGQAVGPGDDFVESEVWIAPQFLGDAAYDRLAAAIMEVEKISKGVSNAVGRYWKGLNSSPKDVKVHVQMAQKAFWQKVDSFGDRLVQLAMEGDEPETRKLMSRAWAAGYAAYDGACPHEGDGKLMNWMKERYLGAKDKGVKMMREGEGTSGGEDKMDGKAKEFVSYVMSRSLTDGTFRAAFRRALDPGCEQYVWGYESRFIDIGDEPARMMLSTVGRAIASSGLRHDGHLTLGEAFRMVARNEEPDTRFMWLLNAKDIQELIPFLHSALTYLESKGVDLSYTLLLEDLMAFRKKPEPVKIKWAKEFYNR